VSVGHPLIEDGPPASGEREGVDASYLPDLRKIFDEYSAFVWRTLRHLGIREADIPDVCQEVFITVDRRLSTFEGRSALRTWLYGICLRTASDHRRRAHVRREVAVDQVPTDQIEADQPGSVDRGRARERLLQLLDALDDDKRAVFVLYEVEELGMKEVAEIVGCPLQTAYSRLHAARKLLASELEEHRP
jgi:RNA polymerase sigma-70 factor (ECF subfamily)